MSEVLNTKYKWWIRDILELSILLAVIAFMAVIYLPRMIWDEEEAIQAQSHFYMEHVYDVLGYYQKLTGERTTDGQWAVKVVNAARDSLTADSTFLGKQDIHLGDKVAKIEMFPAYGTVYDTSFGFLKTRKDTVQDTIMTVVNFNLDESRYDTSFVRKDMMKPYLEDTTFVGISDTTYSSHVEVVSYYDGFTPDMEMLSCPLTQKPYIIELTEEDYRVASPIKGNYSERRFLVFAFKAKSHGKIEDGEKSWARF
ncbi:MAG: hypothetical protein CMG71_02890 [Candidatus Marinimicrobia bacterium]|nr:hypothetical protein [Candidatus Neomarinimicrobiota bacterium]|tara:strand:- start:8355 stop:9116 length:762 start_codon:yes stop_codon:yes gene_type:complete